MYYYSPAYQVRCLLFVYLIIHTISEAVGQPAIKIRTDKTEIRLGEQIELNIEIAHDARTHISWPSFNTFTASMEIAKATPIDTFSTADGYKEICSVWLTSFEEGVYHLPDFSIGYKDRDEASIRQYAVSLPTITVKPVAIDTTADIRPIKPPQPVETGISDYKNEIVGTVASLVFMVLLFYAYRRRKSRIKPIVSPRAIPPPAHEWALEMLSELENKKLWQSGEVKLYYSELTEVFRLYLEKRFSIQAMESTSQEIIRDLQNNDEATQNIADLNEILMMADFVKFAKAEPDIAYHRHALQKVRSYILQTKSPPYQKSTDGKSAI